MLTREDQALVDLLGKNSPEVRALAAAAANPGMADAVHEMLCALVRQRGLDPNDPPKFALPDDMTPSDFIIGTTLCGDVAGPDVGPSLEDQKQGLGIFGLPGVGKSTLTKLYILGFTGKTAPQRGPGRPCLILDAHGEYRDLLPFYEPEEMLWLTAAELGINPFAVPIGADGNLATTPDNWLNACRELLRLLWTNEPTINLGCSVIRGLYEDRGVFDGSRNFPSVSDVIEALKRLNPSRMSDAAKARDKLLDRLESLRALLPGLDVARSRDFRKLMERSVLLDLVDVKDIALPFLFSLITMIQQEVYRGEGEQGIHHMEIIEEAHSLLGGQMDKRISDLKESTPSAVLRSARKTGWAITIVTQLPTDLAPSVIGNLGTVISLRQGHRQCVRTVAAAQNLSPRQEEEIPRLPNRHAIARFSRYGEPVYLAVKDARALGLGVLPTPSREEAREMSRAVLEAIPFVKVCEPPKQEGAADPAAGKGEGEPAAEGGLPSRERRVFARIAERPWELIQDRMEALDLDRESEGDARSKLEARGLIVFAGNVGAKSRLFDLTPRGRQCAAEAGLAMAKSHKGSVPHQAIVHYVERSLGRFSSSFRFLRTGVSSTTAGVQPDLLLVTGGGQRIPIQACCHNQPAYEASALLKLHRLAMLEPGDPDKVDFLIAVASSKRHRNAVARALMTASSGEMPGRIALLDFDAVTGASFDWTPIFEVEV